MHNLIFQVDLAPMSKEQYLNFDKVGEQNDDLIDYAYDTDETDRAAFIESFVSMFPDGMFRMSEDLSSLIYQGGFSDWHYDFNRDLQNIANSANGLIPFENYEIIKMHLDNPLETDDFFVIDSYEGCGRLTRTMGVMRLVSRLKVGDRLYIGSILGYHW